MEQHIAAAGLGISDVVSYLWIAVVGLIIWNAKKYIARLETLEAMIHNMNSKKADETQLQRDFGRLEAAINKAHDRIDKAGDKIDARFNRLEARE